MKNKLSVLIVSLILSQIIFAQDGKTVSQRLQMVDNDTLQFIKDIVERKSTYIGKPLDSLLKDLPPIVRYINDLNLKDINTYKTTTLSFLNYIQTADKISKKQTVFIVVITWTNPLNFRELSPIGINQLGGEWKSPAYNYYKNKIIGDISTYQGDSQ